jgi:hypothetical protein
MNGQPDNDARLFRYLLGDLPEEEQVEIEDRAFEDQQYSRSIVAAEADLIDAYIHGQLNEADRGRFAQRFLQSAERRRKVEFARALAQLAPEFKTVTVQRTSTAPEGKFSLGSSLAAFMRGLAPITRFAFAAGVVLMVAGAFWLAFESVKLRSQLRAALETRRSSEDALQLQIDDARTRADELAAQLHREQEMRQTNERLLEEIEQPHEGAEKAPPAIISMVLPSGVPRGSNARRKVVLQQETRLLRMQLDIEPADEYGSFRAELRDEAGAEVWSVDHLTSRAAKGAKVVVLNLPAKLLKSGEYELKLAGNSTGGEASTLGYYYFVVVRK